MTLPPRFYVTGTDTNVGKTVVSALLCAAGGYDYWKPVQAGLDEPTDSERVAQLAGVKTWPETWRLKRAASPHAAARDEGKLITAESFTLPKAPRLVVEGAGGFAVPYAHEPMMWQADLIKHLDLPVILVARSGLGTLNHSFLTLLALAIERITCLGLILVGPTHSENERDLAAWSGLPVITRVPWTLDLDGDFPVLKARMAMDLLR